MSKQPPPAPTASAIGPSPTVIKIVGRPGTGSLPSTIAPPDHPINHQDPFIQRPGRSSRQTSCPLLDSLLRHAEGWLVGCFGFNGPLRQYFSLYRAVSQREGERGEKG